MSSHLYRLLMDRKLATQRERAAGRHTCATANGPYRATRDGSDPDGRY
jgi:hypothetical protein